MGENDQKKFNINIIAAKNPQPKIKFLFKPNPINIDLLVDPLAQIANISDVWLGGNSIIHIEDYCEYFMKLGSVVGFVGY